MAKDVDLFAAAMAGVAPLKGQRPRRSVAAQTKAVLPAAPLPEAPSPVSRLKARTVPLRREDFDRDVDRALGRGKRAPEATLDLHGLTLIAAERAVAQFLAASSAEGLRVVLVVTGKGLQMESGKVFGGRIRSEFPGWLERPDNRALIAGVRAAHPRHGSSGAFYVLLRRQRP